ncbi:MAG: glutamate decarboxylase [Proteobacteria bacterium]|nr:glutamate decarboxylase [Pseudomonadota bacterium]
MITKEKIKSNDNSTEKNIATPFAGRYSTAVIPRMEIPTKGVAAKIAYRVIHDQLLLDGRPDLNLSSFVTTWMEPEAEQLIQENLNKNFIDHFQYPQTQIIEGRCVNILAKLFHAPEENNYAGTSTIGSSEAIMLGLLAHKWKWKKHREQQGKSTTNPNIIFGAEAHVCVNKFAKYFDVEPRIVPMSQNDYVLRAEEISKYIDENTICVALIVGTTYTGQVDPIGEVNDLLVKLNKENGWDIGIHIDGASGAFVMCFAFPDIKWDFRYERVRSINTSGHKYGLVYPGIGWLIFRDIEDLASEIIFHVNYLGQTENSYTLNFSKPASGVIAQYYNFIRLGSEGYKSIMESILENAQYLSKQITASGKFKLLEAKTILPIVTFQLVKDEGFTIFDVSYKMKEKGWIISAYNLPPHAENVYMLRVVVRENFTHLSANIFMKDLLEVYEALSKENKTMIGNPHMDKTKSSANAC